MFWEGAPYTDKIILLVGFEPFSSVEGNIGENMKIWGVSFLNMPPEVLVLENRVDLANEFGFFVVIFGC